MPDEPFIHPPDHVEPAADELFCFKDMSRPCKPDCMAYQTFVPEGDDYKGQPWAHCRLLVDSYRTAKHLPILARSLSDIAKTLSNESADRKRQPTPPPSPR